MLHTCACRFSHFSAAVSGPSLPDAAVSAVRKPCTVEQLQGCATRRSCSGGSASIASRAFAKEGEARGRARGGHSTHAEGIG